MNAVHGVSPRIWINQCRLKLALAAWRCRSAWFARTPGRHMSSRCHASREGMVQAAREASGDPPSTIDVGDDYLPPGRNRRAHSLRTRCRSGTCVSASALVTDLPCPPRSAADPCRRWRTRRQTRCAGPRRASRRSCRSRERDGLGQPAGGRAVRCHRRYPRRPRPVRCRARCR